MSEKKMRKRCYITDPVQHQYRQTLRSSPNKILYPPHASEFEVQAELYSRLRNLLMPAFTVRGCVRAVCEDRGKQPRVFFDLVVFYDRKHPTVIIECKNNHDTSLSLKDGTRQHRRYSKFNVPLLQCPNMEALEPVCERVMEITEATMEPWAVEEWKNRPVF